MWQLASGDRKKAMSGPVLALLLALIIGLGGPAMAQDDPVAAAWQGVITRQIEALRQGDAPTALSLSDARLRRTFSQPANFVEAIVAWGYGPIVYSRAHSFGTYRMLSPEEVVQDVRFIGADQGLYEAHYLIGLEDGVWAGTPGRPACPEAGGGGLGGVGGPRPAGLHPGHIPLDGGVSGACERSELAEPGGGARGPVA
jgi:hypothetical protein